MRSATGNERRASCTALPRLRAPSSRHQRSRPRHRARQRAGAQLSRRRRDHEPGHRGRCRRGRVRRRRPADEAEMMPRAEILQRRHRRSQDGGIVRDDPPRRIVEARRRGAIARATWALPVAGLVVGLAGALVYKVASRFGLAPNLAALLALAATTSRHRRAARGRPRRYRRRARRRPTRERKLEIMRDSRIGTYGVCALILSFGLRWSALAAIADPWAVALGAVRCAYCGAARACRPSCRGSPPARPDGLSASAGSPPGRSVAHRVRCWNPRARRSRLGLGKALVSLILLSLAGLMLARLAIRQIGGQTGDILGAFEQTGEILILLVAAAFQIGG